MGDYVIVTDSSADLTPALVEKTGVEVFPLSFTIKDKTYHNYPDDREMSAKQFYSLVRAGERATTAAVNVADLTQGLEPIARSGKDILILSFSSGLSATYQSGELAAAELREQFPERKFYVVDTLSASLGQGMLVCLAAEQKANGKTIEEVRDWVEAEKFHLCHWFTVDDLNHLKRGGRVSAATALVGTMLSIKPVLHMDNEGHLISMGKARGRAASLKALVDKMQELAIEPGSQTPFISHGDCEEDAKRVADEIKARFGVKEVVINNVGPVIGAHTGTGVVALFFLGKER
ncbi:MAG: DegV family protein [Clostridia bacterium]|nr:DegV family protein [Clostridia bacterium]